MTVAGFFFFFPGCAEEKKIFKARDTAVVFGKFY